MARAEPQRPGLDLNVGAVHLNNGAGKRMLVLIVRILVIVAQLHLELHKIKF
jgi:hypothetical protein